MRILSIIILLLFCQYNKAADYTIQNSKGKTQFPFRVFNNIIVVDVEVNQDKTLQFIFDSGCKSTIIIHPMWVDSFTIPIYQKVYFIGLGIKDSVETIKINENTLKIGQLTASKIPMYIFSKDSINLEKYLGINVDGIFGAEIFERFYVHINYKTKYIELYEKKPSKKINKTYTKIPVTIRKSKGYTNCIFMNAMGDMYASELLFDTGANLPLIVKNIHPNEVGIHKYIEAEIGEGLSGAMYSKIGRMERLFIDTFTLSKVIAAFSETPVTSKELNKNEIDGNIGNDILTRFDTYFAYPENAIYWKPNKTYRDDFEFNISNIILLENKTRNKGFIVKSIASQSAPEIAGLQAGDEILKIDNYKSSELKIEDALSLLNKRIGKKINLVFERNKIRYKISYKLTSII